MRSRHFRLGLLRPFVIFATSVFLMAGVWAQSTSGAVDRHAHVHGVAKPGIAMQGSGLTLSFESPPDSLIGFEHRPRTAAEHSATADLQARMQAPGDLFEFNTEAGCAFVKAEAESAISGPPPASTAAETHTDLDATFADRCAQPGRLATADTGLLKACPKLQKLDVEIATDQGQSKQTWTSPARRIDLGR